MERTIEDLRELFHEIQLLKDTQVLSHSPMFNNIHDDIKESFIQYSDVQIKFSEKDDKVTIHGLTSSITLSKESLLDILTNIE